MEASTSDQERSSSKPVQEAHLDLLKRGTLSDVTFIVGPTKERIPCHQLFLVARSPVFEVMFSERWNGVENKEIPIENVDPKIFKKFLQFIYADTIVANAPEALELLQVAHTYDVTLLVSRCEELIMENEVPLDDALDFFQAARKYERVRLMDKAVDSMAKWLPKLPSRPSFSRMDKETLICILKRKCINMAEVKLFSLCLEWANNQTDSTLEQSLEDILPLIRFPVMTLEEFTRTVVPSGLLSQSTLVEIFTYFGTDAETRRKSMASALKFSTQRRRRIGSIHYFDLYSEDLARKETKRVWVLRLKDCLQISIQITGTKAVGIDGISVYCPAFARTAFGPSSSALVKFMLVLDHEIGELQGGPSYKNLLTMYPIEVKERKMTEIKLDSFIPLENNARYRITFEKMHSACSRLGDFSGGYHVDAIDFGRMRNCKLSLKGNNNSVVIGSKTKNEPPGDLNLNSNLDMICKLSFEEL